MTNKSWVPNPGEYIREELEAREWSQRDLAYILGCQEQVVNMLLSGKRGISSEMAKALGNAFDVPAELFANLQRAYDLANARDPDPGIAKRANIQSIYPLREMIKRGWLENSDPDLLCAQVARYFEVSSIDDVPRLEHAAKKTDYDEEVNPKQLAWLFRVKQIAKSLQGSLSIYSEEELRKALVTLKYLMADPTDIRQIPKILAECGVIFIIVEFLPGAKIDGVCFWLEDGTPVIGMSLWHDKIDNFWFVLRHEIEHVLCKHGQTRWVIDIDVYEPISDQERAVNRTAADWCIPEKEMDSFIARKHPFFSERDMIAFAKVKQVHPGIVIGQFQHRTERYDFLTKYLVKIRHIIIPNAFTDGWGQIFPVEL